MSTTRTAICDVQIKIPVYTQNCIATSTLPEFLLRHYEPVSHPGVFIQRISFCLCLVAFDDIMIAHHTTVLMVDFIYADEYQPSCDWPGYPGPRMK